MKRQLLLSLVALATVASCGPPTTFSPIADGEQARYQDGLFVPPPEWVNSEFDDSGWRVGPLKLGIGKHVATKLDGLGRDYVTMYVRIPFDLGPTAAEIDTLHITAPVLGGGYVLYVNGVEVARDGITKGSKFDQPAARAANQDDLEISVPLGTLRPAGNIVAVEARCPAKAQEMAVGFTLEAVIPADLKGVVRGPYVQLVRTDGATIVYDTADAVAGKVVVDGRTFTGPVDTHHELSVTGLDSAREYPYHVVAGPMRSEELTFATAPGRGEPVTFIVYGDTRTNGDIHRRVIRAMTAEGADAALITGDLVATGGDLSEWDKFFTIEYPFLSRTAVYPVVGNHETLGSGGVDFFKDAFALPKEGGSPAPERLFSFDVGDVHFVGIDSNLTLANQVAWVSRDVRAAKAAGAREVFFYMHQGPYSSGKHGGSGEAKRLLVPLMKELGVTAIFAGHDHLYERGHADGIRYFVTGGGGAPLMGFNRLPSTDRVESKPHYLLVTVTGDHVRVDAKDIDGEIFDSAEW